MGYLRQVRSSPEVVHEATCVAVYERELDYLFETLGRLGADPREVEDLAHEVFLVLFQRRANLDLSRSIRSYLFAVAFRVTYAHRRRQRRAVRYLCVEPENQGSGPEESLESKESRRLLMAALDTVPLPRRAVIIMHDLDGLSIVDIAASLSLTRFGAHARLRKGRKELASGVRRLLSGRGSP